MHKEAYLLFFGYASAVDFEFGETEQNEIDTLVKAYNEAPEEWKPELLAAGPEYLRVAITGEKDKPMWKPFVPDPRRDIEHLFETIKEGKHVVLVNKRKKEIYRIFSSSQNHEVYFVSIIVDPIPALGSYRYDDTVRGAQIEFLLSCSSYNVFDTEEEAMQFMPTARKEINKEA